MIIRSDWHIHSESSYDATLPLQAIADGAKSYGFERFGITDHANLNDKRFVSDLHNSARSVKAFQKEHPNVILGVELTPISKPEYDYIQKHGSKEGYVEPQTSEPYAIELAQTKEELLALGVRYAIGASHWRTDVPYECMDPSDINGTMKEWFRQQVWLACDERVTILGHPWYNGKGLWYEDFTRIPRSMNMELAAALKENGKYVECNSHFFRAEKATEKFRRQYAEFLRELFEMGIPVTYGSDAHKVYNDIHLKVEEYLSAAGFVDGDISGLSEEVLW